MLRVITSSGFVWLLNREKNTHYNESQLDSLLGRLDELAC